MNNLEKISKDFYDCVNIPIRYIDSSFNVKHNISSSSIDVFIDELEIYKDINKNEICTNQILNYDNIHFIIKPFQYRGDTVPLSPDPDSRFCQNVSFPMHSHLL